MENKITKRDNFKTLLAITEVKANPELVKFIEHEIALLDKKNVSRKNEMTETQKENLILKDKILDYLTKANTEMSCSQIAKEFGLSTQRTSPILEKLIADNKLVKESKKRINYFRIV